MSDRPAPQSHESPNVLTTEHLGRSVGGVKLVDDISVQVRAGEVLAVVEVVEAACNC